MFKQYSLKQSSISVLEQIFFSFFKLHRGTTMKKLVFALAMLFVSSAFAQKQQWELDRSHSSVNFTVSHMVVSETAGRFDDFWVNLASDKDDFTDANIKVTIKTKSISTDNAKRDEHLRTNDFFDAPKFPEMTFVGKKLEKVGPNKYKLTGDFTIKGVTRTETLDVKLGGVIKDPYGNTRVGFKITGVVDRKNYGMTYGSVMDNGGLVIGNEVEIACNVEFTKKK